MSLDTVELVMEVEEEFSVSIPDEVAGGIETVGQLYDFILNCREGRGDRCVTAMAFYRLRRGMMESLGIDRAAIRPTSELSRLIPKINRQLTWQRLEAACGLRLPALGFGTELTALAYAVIFAFAATAFFPIAFHFGAAGVELGMIAAVIAAIISLAVVEFGRRFAPITFRTRWPRDSKTVGRLSRAAAAINYKSLSKDAPPSDDPDVWRGLQQLIVEQLGVTPEVVTRDASFVKDLGAG